MSGSLSSNRVRVLMWHRIYVCIILVPKILIPKKVLFVILDLRGK
uniref:Uncharacterized protein n=1 Tax=Anguilla anguilla TaxID=7936 RepID=A0A0E9U4A0_ANGAN